MVIVGVRTMSIPLVLMDPVQVSTGSNRPLYQWTATLDGVNSIGLALDTTFASDTADVHQLYPRTNLLTIFFQDGSLLQMDGGGLADDSTSTVSGISNHSFPLVRCSPGNTNGFTNASYAYSVTTDPTSQIWTITVITSTCPTLRDNVSIPRIRIG